MRESASQNGAPNRPGLYPPREPFHQQMLDVSGGHRIYFEQSGKTDGAPVLVLHGGPGSGCTPAMRRFFDPEHYRAVLFDQRGCGRSTPHAGIENNTTWDLVADIEQIRTLLGIESWTVFGGSWGSTLALLYAQKHPERVTALVLRGIFTLTKAEIDWFYRDGAGRFWPEQWRAFQQAVPEAERGDLVEAYARRLFGSDDAEMTRYAEAWAGWESALAVLDPEGRRGGPTGAYARAFARLENHYFRHDGWLECDGQILRDMQRIRHLPGYIVQGRYDMICPPHTAYALHEAWPGSDLRMVSTGGHALSEPGITAELVAIMDGLRAG
jgi:proline iminopeptidase